jgi:hypothetical protein
MAHAAREKRSMEKIEEQTTALLEKNNQLMAKWIELYRKKRNDSLSQQKFGIKKQANYRP